MNAQLSASRAQSQKVISSLQHKSEERFKVEISNLKRRESFHQITDNCENYLNLFDSIREWRDSSDGQKKDLISYIYKTFVDASSFQHVEVEEHIAIDMRCLVFEEVDFMPTFRSKEIIDALERIAVTKLMEMEAKILPGMSPRLLSPRLTSPRSRHHVHQQDATPRTISRIMERFAKLRNK